MDILNSLFSERPTRRGGRPGRGRFGGSAWLLVWVALAAAGRLSPSAKADGIPEPSMILYGVVTDTSAGGARVSFGPLTWVFQPSGGGPPVTASGVLTNINDQFSYVLRVPCETPIVGSQVTSNVLTLAPSPILYSRSLVTVSGVPARFVLLSLTNLTLTASDRGRVERIDLTVNLNSGGALPDAWQIQYFGHTGVDPNADPDGDGMSNLAEYLAGTSPTDGQSRFEIIRVTPLTASSTIQWSSVQGKFYTVQRSTDLLTGFADLQTHVPGTAPLNSYQDTATVGGGPYFYRIRVE
jgi:hypothetical protein